MNTYKVLYLQVLNKLENKTICKSNKSDVTIITSLVGTCQ